MHQKLFKKLSVSTFLLQFYGYLSRGFFFELIHTAEDNRWTRYKAIDIVWEKDRFVVKKELFEKG